MRSVIIALFFLLLTTGCSTLHTELRNDIDWAAMKTVEMPDPAIDNWNLRPIAEQELKATGLTPLPYGSPAPDLRARFQLDEASDLTETGAVRNRVKSIQLQLFDRSGRVELARSSYELSSTQNLKQGVNALFKGLRKQLRNVGSSGTAVVQNKPEHSSSDMPQLSPKGAAADSSSLATTQVETNQQKAAEQVNLQQKSESTWLPRFQGWDFSNRNHRFE